MFFFLKYIIKSFNAFYMVIETDNIFYFFSNRCSRSMFSNGADGYNLSHLCFIYIAEFIQNCPSINPFWCYKKISTQAVLTLHY